MQIGETLGRYRIVEHLGHGGMAEVYKAYHPGLERFVAVKVLHPFLAQEEGFLTRFRREAKAVAALRHPNIVQVFDFDHDPARNVYYMVMEFIDGPSLKARLQELAEGGQQMPLDEAVRIISAVGDALSYAHRRGMVHRDVKPANVMFNSDGQAILTDFGIARMVDVAGLTASGSMIGTPAYMAPEQGMGQAGDERSDVYSLGVMLYQLTTGTLPFEADTPMGIVLKHIGEPLPSPRLLRPDLPEALEQVILRATAKDPAQRYQTAVEFVADLRRAAEEKPGEEPQKNAVTPAALEQTVRMEAVTPVPPSTLTPAPGYLTPPPFVSRYPTPPPAPPILPPEAAPAPRPRRRVWPVVVVVVVLLLLAIGGGAAVYGPRLIAGLPGGSPSPTVTPTPDLSATRTAATMVALQATLEALTAVPSPTSTPTATPTPTPTPNLTATAMATCRFDATVAEESPVPALAPGQEFTKRWRLTNSGTCPWPPGVRLTFVSGDPVEVVATPNILDLGPGDSVEVLLALRAPVDFGTYANRWQLQDEEGHPIGGLLEVAYRVGPTPTPRPVATPTSTPTPTPAASPTPVQPLEMGSPYLLADSCWANPNTGEWGGTMCWNVTGGWGEYHYFVGSVSSEFELPTPCHEFRVQVGHNYRQKYYTTAGTGIFWPLPAGCCDPPAGRYETAQGVAVWRVGEVLESQCH